MNFKNITDANNDLSSNGGFLLSTHGTSSKNMVISNIGKIAVAHNRELIDVGTREKVTWIQAETISEITVVAHAAAGTPVVGDGVFVTFDATSDALADTWLLETEYVSADSKRYFVPIGVPRTFSFIVDRNNPVYVERADAIIAADSGITAAHIIFEAN